LDAFDFTVFLFLLVPIAKEFHADLTLVVLVGSLTMWMRFVGAVSAGWMADRIGRRAPLMISILWYSACNFIAGFSPTFLFLLVFRTRSRGRSPGRSMASTRATRANASRPRSGPPGRRSVTIWTPSWVASCHQSSGESHFGFACL
jgi:MFS family permease